MNRPLVTVVCLCYNHEQFVRTALQSVFNQTYSSMQLIVIDDASGDRSVDVIREELKNHPDVTFLALKKNIGNCKAFNQAMPLVKGEYVIDLAADDVLMTDRVAEGVNAFESAGKAYGINFTDAENISIDEQHLSFHSDRFPHASIPEGDIYKAIIEKYFISTPTVMIRKKVLDDLEGYDESLAYEDFDLFIRAARNFKFCYTPKVLVKKRLVPNSMSNQQFKRSSPQLISTYRICLKILGLNRSADEQLALSKRLIYEMSVAMRLFNFTLTAKYLSLWWKNKFLVLPAR